MESVFKSHFILLSLALASISIGQAEQAVESTGALAVPLKPNRTVPKLEVRHRWWETVSSPTVEDIFQARVFEEPLVPVGGEPS